MDHDDGDDFEGGAVDVGDFSCEDAEVVTAERELEEGVKVGLRVGEESDNHLRFLKGAIMADGME